MNKPKLLEGFGIQQLTTFSPSSSIEVYINGDSFMRFLDFVNGLKSLILSSRVVVDPMKIRSSGYSEDYNIYFVVSSSNDDADDQFYSPFDQLSSPPPPPSSRDFCDIVCLFLFSL